MPQDEIKSPGDGHGGRQGQNPRHRNGTYGAPLQAGTVCGHRARDATGQDVRCRDRQAVELCRTDGKRRDSFGRRALGIGQMFLADLFADRRPRPSAMATQIFTQRGMNRVLLSRSPV